MVGTTIRLDGFPMTVVGIAPGVQRLRGRHPAGFFVPLMMRAEMIPTDEG